MKIFLLNMKQAVRNLLKNGWQTFFSVAGLVMGVVCLSYSINWLWNETHYDSFRRGYKDVYFIQSCFYEDSLQAVTNGETSSCWSTVSAPQARQIIEQLPSSDAYSLIVTGWQNVLSDATGKSLYFKNMKAVDASYAAIADLRSVAGDAKRALSEPGKMVLTKSRAVEWFGSPQKAMGASITLSSGYTLHKGVYVVGAVVEDDAPMTNLTNDVLLGNFDAIPESDQNAWGNYNYGMIVRTSQLEATQRALQKVETPAGWRLKMGLSPLRTHQITAGIPLSQMWSKLIYPLAFMGISILLLLSAFFNYIAILTTLLIGRVREYALRISMGSSFWRNAAWMLCDVLLMLCLTAFFSGLVMEWVNYYTEIPQASQGVYGTLAYVFLAFSLLVVLGTFYPIFRVHRLYRSQYTNVMEHRSVSKALLFVQLSVCALMLFILFTAYRQMHSIFTADLGFRTENILRICTNNGDARLKGLADHFYDIEERLNNGESPAIVSALAMQSELFENMGSSTTTAGNMGITDEACQDRRVRLLTLPYATFEFFGMKMKEGHWFTLPISPNVENPVILNPEAVEALHLYDYAKRPLPSNSVRVPVLGVMSFRTHTLHQVQEPLVIFCSPDGRTNHGAQWNHVAIYVKYHPGKEAEARAAITAVLNAFDIPADLVEVTRATDHVNHFYEEEENYLRVFTAVAIGSVLITLFGVLSMILYTLRLQRRSIAVRRVFGATFGTLCRHYLSSYIVLTMVGNVVALPCGFWVMNMWLENYDVRISIGWLQPLAIFLVILLLVTVIVVMQIRRVMHEDLARNMHVE